MSDQTNTANKRREVDAVPFWWHTIDLGDGVITPGQTTPEIQQLRAASIPAPLAGRSVLDIGCWDGFFTFWCEARGARVTAVDDFQYVSFVRNKYALSMEGGEGYRTAARHLGSKATFVRASFFDVPGSYDVVLFLGILYHQRHPLLALEHLHRLTGDTAIVETHYRPDESQPSLLFYPGTTLNQDPTNYWGPSLSCVELMLKDVGFRSVELAKTYWDNDHRAIFVARK